jgi:hypothetical protein
MNIAMMSLSSLQAQNHSKQDETERKPWICLETVCACKTCGRWVELNLMSCNSTLENFAKDRSRPSLIFNNSERKLADCTWATTTVNCTCEFIMLLIDPCKMSFTVQWYQSIKKKYFYQNTTHYERRSDHITLTTWLMICHAECMHEPNWVTDDKFCQTQADINKLTATNNNE